MNYYRHRRNYVHMAGAALSGMAYWLLRAPLVLLTGRDLYGIAGVVLGLYICSLPAANMLDILLYARYAPAESPRRRAAWVAYNLLIGLAGWIVIVLGVNLVTRRAG